MKKKLLALFLTAALSLTTVAAVIPVTAADGEGESEPIAVGTDLMPLATTTATKVNVEDGNGYLHIYDRQPNRRHNNSTHTNLVTALGWQPAQGYTWYGSGVNYITFKARISNNWATQAEATATSSSFPADAATMFFRMYSGGNMEVFDFWKLKLPKWNSDGYVDYVNSNNAYATGNNKTKSIAPPQFIDTDEMWQYRWSLTDNPTASYQYKTYSDGVAVALTNEWTDFTFAFVPRFKDLTVGRTLNNAVQQYWVYFTSESGLYRNIPFDIDDFEIYYYDGSTKVSVVSHDFDNIENPSHVYQYEPSDRFGKFFSVDGASKSGYNKHFRLSNITETDYYEVKVPQTGTTASGSIGYTFAEGTKLDTGVYQVTAEARLNFYDGYLDDTNASDNYALNLIPQFIANEDNTANLNVKVNGESIENCNVKSEWESISFNLIVPKGMDFTLESITADFTDDTYSVNKAFDLRNVKLIKTETFIPDSEFETSTADVVYTIEDDAFVATGASDAKIEMVYPESYTEGNRYLTVSGRTNERDGFILDLRGIVDNSEANDYMLSFKVRASKKLSNLKINSNDTYGYDPSWTMVKLSAGLYRGKYVEAAPSTFQPNGQSANYYRHRLGSSGAYWWYFSNDEWHSVDISFNDFVMDEEGVSTRYSVIHFGGAETAYNAVNFDVDDIIVYSKATGKDSPIWKQDFQSQKVGELDEELSARFVPFKETWLADFFRTEEVALEVGEDAPYFTASGVKELKYTAKYEKVVLEPATYTIHADMSYPYFDGNRITVDVGSARLRNYIKTNTNKFDVTAIVETVNSKGVTDTNRLTTKTVGNSWESCEFKYKASEELELKSITFVISDASGAQYTTVCYRNVYIDGSYPPGPGRPDPGITMMLLYKKMLALSVEADLEEEKADRALSDKEVVYPIIDSDFKAVNDGKYSKVKSQVSESFEEGNKYLTVFGRQNNRDGIILDLRRAVLDVSDDNYRLSFRIRTSASVSDLWKTKQGSAPYVQNDAIRLGEGLYNGAYTPASPTIFTKSNIVSAGFNDSINGWYINNNAWTTVDVSFKELKNQNVIHIGGGSEYLQASTVDIDDIKIYVPGADEPVYLEDFQSADTGELTEALSSFFVPFRNGAVADSYRTETVRLRVSNDSAYLTASGATEIKYSSDMTLEPGEYTLHASFNHPNFDGNRISIAQTTDSKKQNYIAKNGNCFDVTAVIETEEGTLTFDSYTVGNYWNDCEFSFKVDKDTVIKSISFKFTDDNGAASTTACFRGVYIDGDLNG